MRDNREDGREEICGEGKEGEIYSKEKNLGRRKEIILGWKGGIWEDGKGVSLGEGREESLGEGREEICGRERGGRDIQ